MSRSAPVARRISAAHSSWHAIPPVPSETFPGLVGGSWLGPRGWVDSGRDPFRWPRSGHRRPAGSGGLGDNQSQLGQNGARAQATRLVGSRPPGALPFEMALLPGLDDGPPLLAQVGGFSTANRAAVPLRHVSLSILLRRINDCAMQHNMGLAGPAATLVSTGRACVRKHGRNAIDPHTRAAPDRGRLVALVDDVISSGASKAVSRNRCSNGGGWPPVRPGAMTRGSVAISAP